MDIKDIIFAAADDNAVAFQELVSAHLQAKAYEAIEALRPEAAASLVGEAKKCDDEDMEDDDEGEDEDEDEDGKKSKVEEELKGKQHKIDKNKNGKIDAHDFKLLRKEEAEELDEISKGTLGSYVKKASEKAIQHAHAQDVEDLMRRDRDPSLVRHHADKKWKRLKGINKATDKLTKEEVELDEADEKQVGKEIKVARLKKDSSDFMASRTDLFPRSATSLTKHLAKKDDEKYGEALKKVKDTPVSKFLQTRKGDGKVRTEEVEQIDELSKDTLGSYIKKASGAVTAKGKHATDPVNTPTLDHMASRSYGWHGKKWEPKDKLKTRKQGIVRAVDKLTKEEVEQVDEVAQPRTQADMLAHIIHQIKTTGHPVATDAQFRATHGKDSSKKASQEPPEDRANYDLAQGGTTTP